MTAAAQSNVIPFAFEDSLVRVVQRGEEPWFVGKDVCQVLEIRDHRQALNRLDEDERGGCIVPTPGGPQEVVVISEPGVFRLIFTSRKEEAERFKRWLAHEVLPQLRRTGRYDVAPEPDVLLDGEPVALINAKLQMVREARHCFGPAKARAIWLQLGLPSLPVDPMDWKSPQAAEADVEDAKRCLAHLLETVDENTVNTGLREEVPYRTWIQIALDGDEDMQISLRKHGLRFKEIDGEMYLWVANMSDDLSVFYRGTPWENNWRYVLKKLPGAFGGDNSAVYSVDGITRRGTFIPERWCEPASRDQAQVARPTP